MLKCGAYQQLAPPLVIEVICNKLGLVKGNHAMRGTIYLIILRSFESF